MKKIISVLGMLCCCGMLFARPIAKKEVNHRAILLNNYFQYSGVLYAETVPVGVSDAEWDKAIESLAEIIMNECDWDYDITIWTQNNLKYLAKKYPDNLVLQNLDKIRIMAH